ncbi:hypothetical protein TNCV_3948731 [Trichonephila clavipes]|nr:hypothetical protein TNCV_3948731 [Trichonephila clavipes]
MVSDRVNVEAIRNQLSREALCSQSIGWEISIVVEHQDRQNQLQSWSSCTFLYKGSQLFQSDDYPSMLLSFGGGRNELNTERSLHKSNRRAIGDGLRNFVHRSSVEDDPSACTNLNFYTTPTRGLRALIEV